MQQRLRNMLYNNPPKNKKFYTVAIDGRGGSGKTVAAEYIASHVPDLTVINGDDYFEPTPNEVTWGDFNDSRFNEEIIIPLNVGQTTINYRPYDWHSEPHITDRRLTIEKGVCIERCYIFTFDLDWDLKIWVETPSDVCFKRGLERDNMPEGQATKAWKEIWQPREDRYIHDTKPLEIADIVLDGTKPFEIQLQ
jgi:uridine kinase